MNIQKKILRYCWLLPITVGLFSCADIDALGTEAKLASFTIVSSQPQSVMLGTPEIDHDLLTVRIPLPGAAKEFPVTVNARITTEGYVADVLGDDLRSLEFTDLLSIRQISLITQSGVPVTYKIRLDFINSFALTSSVVGVAQVGVIDWEQRTMTVHATRGDFPVAVVPTFDFGAGVEVLDYVPGTTCVFHDATTTHSIKLRYSNSQEEVLSLGINVRPQLPNSDLNQWFRPWPAPNDDKEQPGTNSSLFWCTTNDALAGFGTTKTAGESGAVNDFAAQMLTEKKGALGIMRNGASGLFTGFFELDLALLSDPEAMARMGRPFLLRPSGFSFSAKYTPGSEFTAGNPPDVTVEPDMTDCGGAHIRLEHWTDANGKVLYNYSAVNGKEFAAIRKTVLGAGDMLIENTNNTWKRLFCSVNYDESKAGLPVTHIVLTFSSSNYGAEFRVALGSVLVVDNVEMTY